MDLLSIAVVLVVVGVLLWLVNAYIPMNSTIKKVLNITIVSLAILWLVKVVGLLDTIKSTNVHI